MPLGFRLRNRGLMQSRHHSVERRWGRVGWDRGRDMSQGLLYLRVMHIFRD